MLKIALAGRAAEQVVFGRVTNGAASDLEKVTEIARAMVFEWGMSDVVTSRTLRADNYGLSEETKRMRDNEQSHLTDGAYAEAVRLIEKHRASLDRLSQALLEKETLMREEVLLLLADVEPESRASETVGTPPRDRPHPQRGLDSSADSIARVQARGIHHLGVAVEDLDSALATYERLFGAQSSTSATVDDQGVRAASVRIGEGRVELLEALGEDTPVGRFLAKRGPGMHHVAYEVSDLDTALAELTDAGADLIDEHPRAGLFGLEVAFVHPDSVHGVLSEVVAGG